MKKSAFSVLEFILALSTSILIGVAVLPILTKKERKPDAPQRIVGTKICTCDEALLDPDNENIKEGPACKFEFDAKKQNEFYTIQLQGGGAGGSTNRGGSAGEIQTIYFPGLDGEYIVQLGVGGAINKNGGHTVLYRKYTDATGNHIEILGYARGGTTNPEGVDWLEGDEKTELEKGVLARFSASEKKCGSGGDKGQAGLMGEAVIRW